ncbi:MAG TPA: ATP-binding cassette domain-containing protein [Solirubrobacteraceae bacterium]|nr:ATP-binding cassette domain-containing protein [Solirubrobacteraceae bacterium]
MRHAGRGLGGAEAPLVELANVSKRFPDGSRETVVLDEVSLEIGRGGSVGIYGKRRSGKSTLLRIAAGIELPDAGTVCFEGRDVTRMTTGDRGRLLRGTIAFMAAGDWRPNPRESVVDHVVTSVGSTGLTVREAKRRALRVLDQVSMTAADAEEPTGSLSLVDRARVMLARALVREPRLLVVDEPTAMPSLSDREKFCALLRSATREQDMTLVVASEEMAALQGTGVLISIADGGVCTTEESGKVVRFPPRRAAFGERSSS